MRALQLQRYKTDRKNLKKNLKFISFTHVSPTFGNKIPDTNQNCPQQDNYILSELCRSQTKEFYNFHDTKPESAKKK